MDNAFLENADDMHVHKRKENRENGDASRDDSRDRANRRCRNRDGSVFKN